MYGNDREFGRGRGGFSNDRMVPPVREGEEIDVTVESVGEKGDGMAKVKGFVVFVPGTKAGDRVKVKVTRVLSKVGFAQVVGQAAAAGEQAAPAEEAQEEFDPKEELDSEDFGDDGQPKQDIPDLDDEDDSADDSDDDQEDEEEKQ